MEKGMFLAALLTKLSVWKPSSGNFGNKAKLETPCLSMESLLYELSHMLGFNQKAKLS